MARYIDADALIDEMQDSKYANPCNDFQRGVNASIDIQIVGIKHMPTADVVPRAEVDVIKAMLENEALKSERLTDILNSYALQYGTVRDRHEVIERIKREVAREIFEEIEQRLTQVAESGYIGYLDCLAELKKKYLEGE